MTIGLIPVSEIFVEPGFNPRSHFGPAELANLVESIRAHNNFIQTLAVRPREDGPGYWVIAGERRLRAARVLGLHSVPAQVHEVDRKMARSMAIVENVQRKDLSVAEEAIALRDLLDSLGGDREEAARRLVWKPDKIASRLQLLHATPDVLAALAAETIFVGHAELLAALPAETQDKVLPRIIEQKITVAMLREQLEGFAIRLDTAIFDKAKAGCGPCPYNSGRQQDFFENAISSGKCTNKACFNGFTTAAIAQRREQLREDFNVVVLASEKAPGTSIPLVKAGACGVGDAQFATCRTCVSFGAILHDQHGPRLNTVEAPTCFDVVCNAARVLDANPVPDVLTPPDAADAAPSSAASAGDAPMRARTNKAASTRSAARLAVKSPGNPAAVTEAHHAMLARAAATTAAATPAVGLAVALVALADMAARTEGVKTDAANLLEAIAGLPRPRRDDGLAAHIATLALKDESELRRLIGELAARFLGGQDPKHGVHTAPVKRTRANALLASVLGTDLAPFAPIDAAYLSTMTKGAIETFVVECGFAAWLKEHQGEAEWKKLLGLNKAALVEGIVKAGFDFAPVVPSGLVQIVADASKRH